MTRNGMTCEEAIKWLEEMMPEWDYEANLYCAETCYGLGEYVCTEPEGYVFETAIKALEKQIPKKPSEGSEGWSFCPACGHWFDKWKTKYCDACGQAIKWEE